MSDPRPLGNFLLGRARSMRFAVSGIWHLLRTQRNAQIHAAATAGVCVAGLVARLAVGEWCWIVAAIGAVWTAEALNTAIEILCDVACPQFHPLIGKAKDVAAGAVLLASLAAIGVAACILWPRVFR